MAGASGPQLQIHGERFSGQDVRTQNTTAVLAVANILKTSLGPVGLDKVRMREWNNFVQYHMRIYFSWKYCSVSGAKIVYVLITPTRISCVLHFADASGRYWRCHNHQ